MVGATPSQMEKELRALCKVGVPDGTDNVHIYFDGKGKSMKVSAMPCSLLNRPPRLTTQEALALLIGAEAMKGTGIRSYDDAMARAVKKIRSVLGQRGEAQPYSEGVSLAAGDRE